MVQGSNVEASIDAPSLVEIPKGARTVEVTARISLSNNGEDDFVAHAASEQESDFWQVFDEHHAEVNRKPGKPAGVKVFKGVHSYRTKTIAAGHATHGERTLKLNTSKLTSGGTYTIRGSIYGHIAETQFTAVPGAPPKSKKKAKPKAKRAAKKK